MSDHIVYLRREVAWGVDSVRVFGTRKQAGRNRWISCFCYRVFKLKTGITLEHDKLMRARLILEEE